MKKFLLVSVLVALSFVCILVHNLDVVKIDGKPIYVYDTQEKALHKKVTNLNATKKVVSINVHSQWIMVTVTINEDTYIAENGEKEHLGSPIITSTSDKQFELDLSNLKDNQDILVEITFTNNYTTTRMQTFYFALSVNDDNS